MINKARLVYGLIPSPELAEQGPSRKSVNFKSQGMPPSQCVYWIHLGTYTGTFIFLKSPSDNNMKINLKISLPIINALLKRKEREIWPVFEEYGLQLETTMSPFWGESILPGSARVLNTFLNTFSVGCSVCLSYTWTWIIFVSVPTSGPCWCWKHHLWCRAIELALMVCRTRILLRPCTMSLQYSANCKEMLNAKT